MAFIFSDLVVFPVLRIQAAYYGLRMAGYILAVFLVVLVVSAVTLHIGFDLLGLLPDPAAARSVTDRTFFAVDYTMALNLAFLAVSVAFIFWKARRQGFDLSIGDAWGQKILYRQACFPSAGLPWVWWRLQ